MNSGDLGPFEINRDVLWTQIHTKDHDGSSFVSVGSFRALAVKIHVFLVASSNPCVEHFSFDESLVNERHPVILCVI